MGFKITHKGPEFKGQVAGKKIKAALDKALLNHRRKFLPRHFEPEARRLYPDAYEGNKPNRKQIQRGEQMRQKIAAMTRSERKEFFAKKARQNKNRRETARQRHGVGKVKDKNNKIPLYYTGRSKNAILNGHAEMQGPVARRRMKLTHPYYFFIKNKMPDGTMFDKVAAVKAMRPKEDREFGKILDQEIQKYLNENKRKTRV